MPVMQLKKNKMKHLYLGIQDDKYNFFVELIKNLNFVKIEYGEIPVAKNKKESVIANIKKGFADKKAIDNGKLKTFPIENLLMSSEIRFTEHFKKEYKKLAKKYVWQSLQKEKVKAAEQELSLIL